MLRIDWKSLLLGKDDWHFLLNVGIRTTIMFLVILIALRLLGKRGIHQLSVFELGVIIGLGSAAGDPMFYEDVGVLPSIIVFIIVVLLYRSITYLVSKSYKIEIFVEGRAAYVLKDGVILEAFKKQPLGKDEFLATLRQNQVYHLGQVETVVIESDGKLSIFFYPDEKVRYGLPILPDAFESMYTSIPEEGIYSCVACGATEKLSPMPNYCCQNCNNDKFLRSIKGARIK
jgi:uncharacterized membrane protein YcaP (DUF421 family)